MTLFELKRLVGIGEGLHLEFKRKVPQPEKITREMIALANTRGGKLLIGVDDDGTIVGVKDVEEERFALETALASFCHPPLAFSLDLIPITPKREVIVVNVPSSKSKPHFLLNGTPAQPTRTAFVRVKDQAIEASREVIRLMRAEGSTQDTKFEFGPKEHTLMTYLDRHERITVSQFANLANIPPKRASQTLVLLTKAGLLRIHPDEKEDYFTLAYDIQD